MLERYGKEQTGHITIEIEKRIPIAAGLAGGSANCAAALHALNYLWDLDLDLQTLMKLGAELGADVPFCLAGQAALNEQLTCRQDPLAGTCAIASGIGDQLELVTPLKAMGITVQAAYWCIHCSSLRRTQSQRYYRASEHRRNW